jgi:membrane fusion protein, multidrug efflux system
MNRIHQSFLTALALLALTAGTTGCGSEAANATNQAEAERRVVRVETLVLSPASFEERIEITGSVEALEDARLSAQAGGTLLSLAPRGTLVRAGQIVAQLDAGVARASVNQAEAAVRAAQSALELAEDNYRRQLALYRDSVISSLEYENIRSMRNQTRAQLDQAQAQLTSTRAQLRNTQVVAPFAGIVEAHFIERGEQVSPGAPVLRIVNSQRVRVRAGVPERFAADITQGTPVEIGLAAYGGPSRAASVSFVGRAVDPQNRTFTIEIDLPNPGGELKPEMVASVYVTRLQLQDVIVVPQSAILRDERGTMAYVVRQANGRDEAESRIVTTGPSYGGQVVILSGLNAGDELIVTGQNNVTRGDLVEILNQQR